MGSHINTGMFGNTVATNSLKRYDKRFSKDLENSAKKINNEFPLINTVTKVSAKDMVATASMDGYGQIRISKDLLNDYEASIKEAQSEVKKDEEGASWSSGNGTIENNIFDHELAHNIDRQFMDYLTERAPTVNKDLELWGDQIAAYNKLNGTNYDAESGEVFTVPTNGLYIDSNTKFVKIGDKNFSLKELKQGNGLGISDIVVPMAIQRVQAKWKILGFDRKPTEQELIHSLSRYAYSYGKEAFEKGEKPTHPHYNPEIFAESYVSHSAFRTDAHPLAREIMDLTKQAYNSVRKRKTNRYKEFSDSVFKYRLGL